tara:strand:+ start:346 stop:900 length:555 start_codon:yes stop_codon:yes gene_type:complete
MDFEHFTTPALYSKSKEDSFRDVSCTYCGTFGSATRIYPADSAPANLTVKGVWGKHASPGLKGKEFYTKQERDRQLDAVGGSASEYDGEGLAPKVSSSTKTYKTDKEGKVIAVKRIGQKLVPVGPKKPSVLIREYAEKNGGSINIDDLAAAANIDKKKLRGGIMSGIRMGWLLKTETVGTYFLR